jgi:hypothetical protein
MDEKRIVPSEPKIRQTSRAANSGAIIRHFNFHQDLFVLRSWMLSAAEQPDNY